MLAQQTGNAIHFKSGTRSAVLARLAAQILAYDEIVRSSLSSTGSITPTRADPHAPHFKL
jgi:hypothetical protein